MGSLAKQRAFSIFSTEKIVGQYLSLYKKLLGINKIPKA
jgi:hypothetical protein